MQKKQIMQFAVETQNGVQRIGKSAILQPKPNFKGGSVKWYPDKPKQKSKQLKDG